MRYAVFMVASTSFRLSAPLKDALAARAQADGVSTTSLLERLIAESLRAHDHPGIVFRGPPHDRRAALAAGPDVWEVVSRLRELDGPEETRITALTEESDVHPRLIRAALDYAAEHPAEIQVRLESHEESIAQSRRAAQQRAALLA